ncbi:MAG: NmrA family transcriptional regulator, partial [Nonomuraea sp.]|nr:NmrA family transcriptional regulator [Nonomuraea sp.]
MIVVTGATGSIGRELAGLLGERALAEVRRPVAGRHVLADLER